MRVKLPADEIRSICKVSLSKNPRGLTIEDFTYLVPPLPRISAPLFRTVSAPLSRAISTPLLRSKSRRCCR